MNITNNIHTAKSRITRQSFEGLLALRGLLFSGTQYICPCCGSRLRAFTHGGASFKVRPLGYCPRCNAKARHRRLWLFLEQNTNLFSDPLKLLHFKPNYGLSRRFINMPNLTYVGAADHQRANISARMELTSLPIPSETFDAIICNHVLEHIPDDRRAIHELYRVLKPGGWAAISVPIRLDQKTFEDPTIITPEERERAFGETVHVRFYGYDLMDRLVEPGFQVKLDLGKDVDPKTQYKYGLRNDENIFFCTKAKST
jgi:SAM-dependent methyltransferase